MALAVGSPHSAGLLATAGAALLAALQSPAFPPVARAQPSDLETWSLAGQLVWPTHADGTLELPPAVREVIIDVGVHAETQFFKHAVQSEEIMVIGFEPLGYLAARHRKHPRVLVVPAAVGQTQGPLGSSQRILHAMSDLLSTFSSLQELTKTAKTTPLPGGLYLGNAQQPVLVDVVSLEEVLRRIPPGVDVRMVKVDAQGSDLEVVRSAGAQLHRVARVQVECQDLSPGHRSLLYAGQPTKGDFLLPLRDAGFVLERCWDNNPLLKEENCIFARSDLVLDVRGGCFKRLSREVSFMAALKTTFTRHRGAFDGPLHVTRHNEAVLLEQFCCGGQAEEPLPECFDEQHSYERCCLKAYFEAIDHLRDWALFQLEFVVSHNSSQTYIVLHP